MTVSDTTSTVLLVLGLPQCGIDAVSTVLQRCGAQGDSDEEHLAQAQCELLNALGSGWDSPLELEDRCLASVRAQTFVQALDNAFAAKSPSSFSMACVHGMERVLPLWHRALEQQQHPYRHLLVVRHPLAVAEQFRQLHRWDRDRALLVWLQSTLAMERHSHGHPRVVLNAEQVRWDVDATLNLIEGQLQLTLPERNHKALLALEKEASQWSAAENMTQQETTTSGSLLLTMALHLHWWLLAESEGASRLTHLPQTIRQQLKLAESLMGRTLNDLSLQNDKLSGELKKLEQRRTVRLINWFRGTRQAEAA